MEKKLFSVVILFLASSTLIALAQNLSVAVDYGNRTGAAFAAGVGMMRLAAERSSSI